MKPNLKEKLNYKLEQLISLTSKIELVHTPFYRGPYLTEIPSPYNLTDHPPGEYQCDV